MINAYRDTTHDQNFSNFEINSDDDVDFDDPDYHYIKSRNYKYKTTRFKIPELVSKNFKNLHTLNKKVDRIEKIVSKTSENLVEIKQFSDYMKSQQLIGRLSELERKFQDFNSVEFENRVADYLIRTGYSSSGSSSMLPAVTESEPDEDYNLDNFVGMGQILGILGHAINYYFSYSKI